MPSTSIGAALALILIAAGVVSIAFPVPAWPVVLTLAALAWHSRRALNPTARIIGGLVVLLYIAARIADWPPTTAAMDRVFFLSAFLVALGLLSQAATRSRLIRDAATIIANRPRGARYVFVNLGTHLFAVFLNVGAITLMATLLAQSRAVLVAQNAMESLSLGMLRGFAAMPMWSPLALSTLITLSILPEVNYFHILPYGLGAAALYTASGFYLARQRSAPDLATALPSGADWIVLARVIAIVALLVVIAFTLKALLALSLPSAILLAVLALTAGWWGVHAWNGAPAPVAQDLAMAAQGGINEIVIVSGAGFMGALIGDAMQSAAGLQIGLSAAFLSVLVGAIPMAMVLSGYAAMNPILSASLLLGILHPIVPTEGLPWLALAAILGWGLTAAASPFSANVLITSRIMGLAPGPLVRSGNARLTALGVAVFGLACGMATFLSIGR